MKLILVFFCFLLPACSSPDVGKRPANAHQVEEWVPFDYSYNKPAVLTTIAKDSFSCQACFYDRLSYKLNYEVTYNRFQDGAGMDDSAWAIIRIRSKSGNALLDSVYLQTWYGYYNFPECHEATSFITDFDSGIIVADNDYGEFVVADLNFDAREDFAVVRDHGASSGPMYVYFMQMKNGKYEQDHFLTDSMMFFPTTIIESQDMLVLKVHAGVCGMAEHRYKYTRSTKTWKETSPVYRDICE